MVHLSACALFCLLSAADQAVLLEFTADWCGACRAAEPTVQRMLADGYPVQRIHVDRDQQAAARFNITSVPCFILVVGGREVERVEGAASYARLVEMFRRTGSRPGGQTAAPLEPGPSTIRGQSPPAGGFGLPRPLASLAKGLREGSPTTGESRNVGVPSAAATSQGRQETDPRFAHPEQARSASPVPAAWPANPAAVSPAVSPNDPLMQEALRATVRLRVEDGSGHSLGTGTIIDMHGEEALVVTCGHIFRDSRGQGPISVDCFAGQQPRTVKGTLISCDLDRDIAMVAITPGMQVRPARIATPAYQFSRGQPVFSAGCDKGADPTVRVSAITAIDRYLGAPNLEVAGMPVEGRSGGGLFSAEGFLIGVCNAADPQDQEGIFASLPVIHWELDKIGQRALYDRRDTTGLVAAPQPATHEETRPMAAANAPVAGLLPPEMPRSGTTRESLVPSSDGDTEVICIVRSRTNPQGSERLFVLDRPSADLLQRLTTESQRRVVSEVAHVPPARSVPLESQNRANPYHPPLDRGQIIRAQSHDR